MKKMLLALVSTCLLSLSLYAIEGTYSVKGYDPYEKKAYTGKIEITKKDNGVYQAKWVLDLAPKEYTGTGLMTGNQVNFVFESSSSRTGGGIGLQNYTISGDTLQGPFVYYNKPLVGTETLTKKKSP